MEDSVNYSWWSSNPRYGFRITVPLPSPLQNSAFLGDLLAFLIQSPVLDYGIGIVGNCLGPTTSKGLRKMDAKYFQHHVSQSVTNVLCIVSTDLSIFCTKIPSSHKDIPVQLHLAAYRTYLPATM